MFDIFLIALAVCAVVCLAYYFIEGWGEPPEDPDTQPPTVYLSDLPEDIRKQWEGIK